MMQTMINLVATRQKAGEPAELLRWYNDHVTLLMGFENLASASLYRCTAIDQAAPEYVCLYDFPNLAAFEAFEASQAKERARQVMASGWGTQSIEVLQRSKYLTGGKRTEPSSSSEQGVHIQCLDVTPGPAQAAHQAADEADDFTRWMSDSLYLAAARTGVNRYAWYASLDQRQVIVLASTSTKIDPAWRSWWDLPASGPLGIAPSAITAHWQAGYQHLSEWCR
jgi:hypothetical protein